MLDKLAQLIEFDLTHGPYIVGSYATYKLGQQFHSMSWQPKDIDIICRSEEQMFHLKDVLLPISGYYNEKERTVVNQMFGVHPLQMIWVIDGITVTAAIRDHSAMDQIKSADYTVTAVATDCTAYLASMQTIADVRDNILAIQSLELNSYSKSEDAIGWLFSRYHSYVQRGYVDKDNRVLKELNTFVAQQLTKTKEKI